MALIKITRGTCGIRYTDKNGHTRNATRTEADGFFECDDTQAARFVRLGVAVYQEAQEAKTAAAPTEDAQEDTDPETEGTGSANAEGQDQETAHLDAEQLRTMTVKELAALAADMGLSTSKCKKKEDFVQLITAEEVILGPASEGEDDLPDLDAADPV